MMEEAATMDGFWTVEKQEKLCEMWRDNAAVFNPRHSGNRMLRNRTLQEFANTLGCNRNEVKRRMINMRTQYAREKKKAVKVWHFYHHLRFLDSYNIPKVISLGEAGNRIPSEKNHQISLGQISSRVGSTVNTHRLAEQLAAIHDAKRRKRREEPSQPFVTRETVNSELPCCSLPKKDLKRPRVEQQQPCSSNSETEDVHEVYAKYIACEIRSIGDPQVQRLAKLRIQQVLYEVQNEPALPVIGDVFSSNMGSLAAQQFGSPVNTFCGVRSPSVHSENDMYPSMAHRSKFES